MTRNLQRAIPSLCIEMKNINKYLSALLAVTCIWSANAQDVTLSKNFGLSKAQDSSELPRSRASARKPERKDKRAEEARLVRCADDSWRIEGGWELANADTLVKCGGYIFDLDYNTDNWYNAVVPGTVLTSLVEQGVYADPYFGLNNLHIPESLCRSDWWYRVEFDKPELSVGKHKLYLRLNGINYKADVWLNGERLGDIAGAFQRGVFEISEQIKGRNVLAVHIYPPHNPGIPHEQNPRKGLAGKGPNGGVLCLDGPTFISSEGWDWVPGIRDRNIGIWQDVELFATSDAMLEDLRVISDLPLPSLSFADLTIRGKLKNSSNGQRVFTLKGSIEDIHFEKSFTLGAGEIMDYCLSADEFPQLRMKNPRLWWPNGYGEQNLYNLDLTALCDGQVSDMKRVRFGVRELSYLLTVDAQEELGTRVEYMPVNHLHGKYPLNNRKLRDWGDRIHIPSLADGVKIDDMLRVDRGSTSPYLVIKVNGVDIFCRGGNWGMDDAMKRVDGERLEPYFELHKALNFNIVRNWTGESTEEAFYDLCDEYGLLVWNDFWWSTEGYNQNPIDEELFMANAHDVVKRFANHPCIAIWCPRNEGYATASMEESLSSMIASEDGTRLYIGNSRYLNMRRSGPWDHVKDVRTYYTDLAKGFNTEFGTLSVPTAETMRTFMAEEDLWPISDTWAYHDFMEGFGAERFVKELNESYGEGASLDDFCFKAQFINYDRHRAMFEAWNSKMWSSATGLIMWMSHPAWPSLIWQAYTYDYETHGSYYGIKKACEPIHIQLNMDDNKVCVVNTSQDNLQGARASVKYYNIDGKMLGGKKLDKIDCLAGSLVSCFEAADIDTACLVRLELRDSKSVLISRNDYAKPIVEKSKIKTVQKSDGSYIITNQSDHIAFGIALSLRDANSGERILPAIFSDNYFNLLPGESRAISVNHKHQDDVRLSAMTGTFVNSL